MHLIIIQRHPKTAGFRQQILQQFKARLHHRQPSLCRSMSSLLIGLLFSHSRMIGLLTLPL
jgi:hypothetical protein